MRGVLGLTYDTEDWSNDDKNKALPHRSKGHFFSGGPRVNPIKLHYMTDRQERFDLKISKLKILWKQRHHLGCP